MQTQQLTPCALQWLAVQHQPGCPESFSAQRLGLAAPYSTCMRIGPDKAGENSYA